MSDRISPTRNMTFEIRGVNGVRDYLIPVSDGRLVLVGENGSGKTTICKMIQLFLSGSWYFLAKQPLRSIQVTIYSGHNEDTIALNLDELKNHFASSETAIPDDFNYMFDESTAMRLGLRTNKSYLSFLRKLEFGGDRSAIDSLRLRFNIEDTESFSFLSDLSDFEDDEYLSCVASNHRHIVEVFGSSVLYLPTYRRIEAALESLLSEDPRRSRNRRQRDEHDMYFENGIIHFGMSDVQDAITSKMDHLKAFSLRKQIELTQGYLHSVLRREYRNVDINQIAALTEKRVSDVLRRIESTTLTDKEKEQVSKIVLNAGPTGSQKTITNENEQIVLHYFTRLESFYKELQHEEAQVMEFCEMCNKYLSYKEIEYDESSYTCRVATIDQAASSKDSNTHVVSLESLSSGEKQIVGLFSKLILEDKENLFIIIDEPEISLSIDWQRTLLPDILGSRNCGCFIAATHSPYVIDNELVESAHGLNEFILEQA